MRWTEREPESRLKARTLLFAAYALSIVIAGFGLLAGASVQSPLAVGVLRGIASVVAAAAGLIAVSLLTDRDESTATATALLTAMLLGSVAFVSGVIFWRARVALALRSLGWLLLVGAAAVPSTLTLALPLLAVLSLTLSPGARTTDDRSRPVHAAS